MRRTTSLATHPTFSTHQKLLIQLNDAILRALRQARGLKQPRTGRGALPLRTSNWLHRLYRAFRSTFTMLLVFMLRKNWSERTKLDSSSAL